jgi:hypothetical protein
MARVTSSSARCSSVAVQTMVSKAPSGCDASRDERVDEVSEAASDVEEVSWSAGGEDVSGEVFVAGGGVGVVSTGVRVDVFGGSDGRDAGLLHGLWVSPGQWLSS